MASLAIIIPAYKIDFFEDTLKSLAAQTCKDFTVYIGDDCSPNDFKSLVDKYVDEIDIVYHRFADNLGGKDLVGHWSRCVALTKDEPWLWLFSDDDVMDKHCVESFYRENKDYDLYHFNVNVIDSTGIVIRKVKPFPTLTSSEAFYKAKVGSEVESFVVEYIFSRRSYEEIGGFVHFNMAWGSDIATWVSIGEKKGIKTISDSVIFWRQSDKNITPDHNNEMVLKKTMVDVDCFKWANTFFNSSSIQRYNIYGLFRNMVYYSDVLSNAQEQQVLKYAKEKGIIRHGFVQFIKLCYPLFRVYKKIKSLNVN